MSKFWDVTSREQLCKKNHASKNLFLLLAFCQHIVIAKLKL